MRWHAFGPLAAGALLWWSARAIHQRRLPPLERPAWPLGLGALSLLAYWLLRLWLSYGLGMGAFPGFPLS